MSLTLPELCEKLAKIDEVTLMERLGITSEDLVKKYIDEIEEKFEELEEEFNDTYY